jgi:hypothetical protein
VLRGQEQQDEAVESVVALGKRALEHLRTATFDDKRTTLHAFSVKMKVWAKDHKPKYEFSWSFDDLHEYWVKNQMKDSVATHS